MPLLLLKDLPRYESLLAGAREFPDLDPSATEAYLNLLRTSDVVFGVMERFMGTHHISTGRFSVLMLLWKASCQPADSTPSLHTPASLASAAGVTRATMTGLVDTLEHDGLVQRQPDPLDRRQLSVILTAKGEQFLRQLLPEHFRLTAAFIAGLSETERKTLVRLLNKILQQADLLRRAPAAN